MTDGDLIPQIIRILVPLVTTEGERRALLIEAFGVDSPILMNVDFDGATRPFILHLVAVLHAFGSLETGIPALVVLFEAAKSHVGADVALKIDELIPRIEELSSRPLPTNLISARKAGVIAVLVLALVAVAVVAFLLMNPPSPKALPPGFNVVVAGFGMERNGSSVRADPLADNVSHEIYAALADVAEIDNLLPWSDPRVGRILGADEHTRRDQAQQLASELNADIVIYGTTQEDGFYLNINPVFEITGDLAALEPELGGHESFGETVQVLKDSDDDLTAETAMQARLTVMRFFLRGISNYITGDFTAALTAFNDAIAINLPGMEMLYVFAGNAALRQGDPAAALTLYSNVLRTRPNYARALGGRGLALFRLGSDLDRITPARARRPVTVPSDAFCADVFDLTTAQDYAALAEICYLEGLASPDQPLNSDIDIKLYFALGQLELWRSLNHYGDYWQQAADYLTRVIDLYNASDPARQARTQQITAQAHAALAQQIISAEPDDSAVVQAAIEHYETAITLLKTDVNRAYNNAFIDAYTAVLTALQDKLQD